MGLVTMGLGTDGSGLNVVLSFETQEEPIEVSPIQQVEVDTSTVIKEIEVDIKKVNIETGEETKIEVEVK